MASGDVFFDSELGSGSCGGRAWDGVGRDDSAGLEAFGGGAEGGPPTGASFFEKEEFGAVFGADEAGGDDFGVIQNEEVGGREEGGEIANGEVGDFAGGAAEEKEAGGVAGMSGGGGNSIRWDGDRKEFL